LAEHYLEVNRWQHKNEIKQYLENAREYWAGETNIELARKRFIHASFTLGHFISQNWGWYYSQVKPTRYSRSPEPVSPGSENYGLDVLYKEILSVAKSAEDKARAHFSIAMSLKNRAHDEKLKKQVKKHFEKVIKDFPQTQWLDDALYELGRFYEQRNEFPKAVKTYKELLQNFHRGDSQFVNNARNQLKNLTGPQLSLGVGYMAFIIPGLVMMAVINNSFVNVVSSFFSSKFQRSIEELLVSPTPNFIIVAGYISGGILRGLLVGTLVFLVSIFFTRPAIHNVFLIFAFILLTSIVFALGGLLNGLLAKKFDDISIFPTFVLTPLIYLGGVFYSIESLPIFWQNVSKFNPVLYMVNGFRFGFHGFSDVNIVISFFILIIFALLLTSINLILLRRGTGLKS